MRSVYLEIRFFSTMESYTNLDLHVHFVWLFRKERFYIDRSNDQDILPTSKLTGSPSC